MRREPIHFKAERGWWELMAPKRSFSSEEYLSTKVSLYIFETNPTRVRTGPEGLELNSPYTRTTTCAPEFRGEELVIRCYPRSLGGIYWLYKAREVPKEELRELEELAMIREEEELRREREELERIMEEIWEE